jgi:adenylate cyclase
MVEESFKRKLTAILSADVKDYSRLMEDDEAETVRTLNTYRTAMSDLIQQYRGRVVDATGDNIMAEFTSVVDAVNCAVEIQRDLAERNAELAYERRMEFRIGVNLGDVIDEDGRIYGEGVNIAARVENLAEPGGICISGRAYDQVANKLGLEYENLGEHQVKNISMPIRVYRVLSFPGAAVHRVVQAKETMVRKWKKLSLVAAAIVALLAVAVAVWKFYQGPSKRVEAASVENMAYPLPDKPSIAVLPFDNLSGDPEQDYFSDGLTEEIITALSKIGNMFVIARNTTFTYKGKPVKIKQVAEDLGVRYVLEGSVRKAEDRVRITAQLIDALKGHHLWAERYDRDLKDIFALQDEITKNILTALQVKLTEGERIRVWSRSTDNLNAFQKFLKARVHYLRFNPDDNAIARQLCEEAIALDPEFAFAIINLAWTHIIDVWFRLSKSPKESYEQATQLTHRAISLGKSLASAYVTLGAIAQSKGQFKEAIAFGEKAVALSPGNSEQIAMLSSFLKDDGRYEEALSLIKKAIRLDPIPLPWYLTIAGGCYLRLERYEEAIEENKKVLHRNQNNLFARISITAAYSLLGREEEARASASEVLRINPKFRIKTYEKTYVSKNKEYKDRYFNALRMAGLPE